MLTAPIVAQQERMAKAEKPGETKVTSKAPEHGKSKARAKKRKGG